MSAADFAAGLDSTNLVLLQTGLTLATAAGKSPSYNFPLFLYGLYAHERADSSESLRTFTGMLGASVLLDIIWLASTSGVHGLVKAVVVLVLLLKVPTVWATMNTLRARGDQFGPLGLRTDTVWSMPGGFPTSSAPGAYQTLGGDRDLESSPAPVPAPPMPKPVPAIPQSVPSQGGGYQTLP
ncbi:hypothetical protein AURDEDRAFT_102466 [Auricularia subglabra TFB-10046 SS5]|nr:hypothetical protein AURDEDRAFT_102466 [Auricularia subglabra TFB-10046 SS5]